MPNLRLLAPLALILAVAGALLYLGWSTLDSSSQSTCSVCGRTVHLASRVDGDTDGKAVTFCCAACALRAGEQNSGALKVTRLFDYASGDSLDPEDATAVVGSNVNLCMREHVLMDAHKDTSELHFDRCSPSILAFKSEDAAERFQAEHGGVVKPFVELEGSIR